MKFCFRSTIILLLAGSFSISPLNARELGRCLGTFEIGKNPLLPTPENLRQASADIQESGCKKTIRVLALVDPAFSPSALAPAGWRLVAQVNDVVSLEGCEHTAPYLTAIPGILSVEHRTHLFPSLDSARKFTHINEVQGYAPSGLSKHFTGKRVLFGILDTEFDTHHPAFLDSLGHTRFVGLWDQTDTSNIRRNRFGYGLIRMQQEIDKDTVFGLGDDSHGTMMAGMAVGSDKKYGYWGAAPEATVIGVKYGSASGTTADIVNGLTWIFSIADSLKMPCVVNMSIGLQEGPHDGTSLVDRAIDSLSGLSPKTGLSRIVVGAAGNDGATRVHIAFKLAAGETKGTLVWSEDEWDAAAPNGGKWLAYSLVDIWGQPNVPFSDTLYILADSFNTFKKALTPLTTNIKTATSQSQNELLWPDAVKGPDTLIIQTFVERANATNQKPHMEIYMFSSNWSLILGVRVTASAACTIHAWNAYKRDMNGDGATSGFSPGDTTMTINEVGGTAHRIITVGSYSTKSYLTLYDGSPFGQPDSSLYQWASWSSIGPTVDGRIKPDICAPGQVVVGAMARNVTDTTHLVVWPNKASTEGRYEWRNGTSISAPIVAGIVALMLQVDSTLTPETVVSTLQKNAINDAFTGKISSPYDVRWGAGKVDALAAIEALGVPVSTTRARNQWSVVAGAVHAAIRGQNELEVCGVGASEQTVVEIFDTRGCMLAKIPAAGNRPVAIPGSIAKGCLVLRVRYKGGVSAAQTFPRL